MYTVLKYWLEAAAYTLEDAQARIDYAVARGSITVQQAQELTQTAQARAVEAPESALEGRVAALESTIGDLVRTETVLSDKLGYNWVNTYVGDVLVKQEYALAYGAEGTADNPIPWEPELELLPGHFYTCEGERKVWTGESGVVAPWDDDKWEVL